MNHQQIEIEHVLSTMLDQERGLAAAILAKAGVAPDAISIKVQRDLD